jgi:hypothetical protein
MPTKDNPALTPAQALKQAEERLAFAEGPKQALQHAKHARANAEFVEPEASAARRAEIIAVAEAKVAEAQSAHDEHAKTVKQGHIDAAAQAVLDARAAVEPEQGE